MIFLKTSKSCTYLKEECDFLRRVYSLLESFLTWFSSRENGLSGLGSANLIDTILKM